MQAYLYIYIFWHGWQPHVLPSPSHYFLISIFNTLHTLSNALSISISALNVTGFTTIHHNTQQIHFPCLILILFLKSFTYWTVRTARSSKAEDILDLTLQPWHWKNINITLSTPKEYMLYYYYIIFIIN